MVYSQWQAEAVEHENTAYIISPLPHNMYKRNIQKCIFLCNIVEKQQNKQK